MSATRPAAADDGDEWTGPDKARHFVAGLGIAAYGDLFAAEFTRDRPTRALIGFGFGTLGGLAKEGADALGDGDPSFPDFAWTVAGAAIGAGLTWLLDELF